MATEIQILEEKAARHNTIQTTVKVKVRRGKDKFDLRMYLASRRPTVRVARSELGNVVLAVHQQDMANKAVAVKVMVDGRAARYTAHSMYNRSVSAIVVDNRQTAQLGLTGVQPGSVVTVQFEEVVVDVAEGLTGQALQAMMDAGSNLLGGTADLLGGALGGAPAQPKREKSTTRYRREGRKGEINIKILV